MNLFIFTQEQVHTAAKKGRKKNQHLKDEYLTNQSEETEELIHQSMDHQRENANDVNYFRPFQWQCRHLQWQFRD